MGRGKQRMARKKRLKKQEQEKRLYICTYEMSGMYKAGYRVQSIRLSDLFSFSDTREPMLSSKLVNQVTYLKGKEVPVDMCFASLGSKIILVGGRSMCLKYITRNLSKPTYVLDTKDPKPRFIPTNKIPELEEYKPHPWVQEINGKLYALSGFYLHDPTFDVLVDAEDDPKWAPLSSLPLLPDYSCLRALDSSTCAVLGTKIFVNLPMMLGEIRTFCFDVVHPKRRWTIHHPFCSDHVCAGPGPYSKVLLLDLEDKEDKEKLMFSYDSDYGKIRVSSMMLSDEGNPVFIDSAGIIDLERELPVPADFDPSSYSFAHPGGQKICFLFMDGLIITVFTFGFSYSPFSFKPLGCLLFDFQFQFDGPRTWGELAGCFVL